LAIEFGETVRLLLLDWVMLKYSLASTDVTLTSGKLAEYCTALLASLSSKGVTDILLDTLLLTTTMGKLSRFGCRGVSS